MLSYYALWIQWHGNHSFRVKISNGVWPDQIHYGAWSLAYSFTQKHIDRPLWSQGTFRLCAATCQKRISTCSWKPAPQAYWAIATGWEMRARNDGDGRNYVKWMKLRKKDPQVAWKKGLHCKAAVWSAYQPSSVFSYCLEFSLFKSLDVLSK